ncbi:hypothetical protein GCM10007939_10690 [Amylibacter marinus]|uniref:Superinfection immunity protein n=1 Tax=Amylibacter marinus TaxID=1475483 RepID=A0ABQ5VTS5_9RHOB|nr:hypothetical protein [Amylibacter marinus]GLQ34786.1 hypothetical protein GCM10007939_10690 [Amylibacter marinus]
MVSGIAQYGSLASQIIPFAMMFVLFGLPLVFLTLRSGVSKFWMLLLIIPVLGWAMLLWMLTFVTWPSQEESAK